jgi:hypothetical protein
MHDAWAAFSIEVNAKKASADQRQEPLIEWRLLVHPRNRNCKPLHVELFEVTKARFCIECSEFNDRAPVRSGRLRPPVSASATSTARC